MTRKEIIDKLESVEREVKEIREYLSQNKSIDAPQIESPLAIEPDGELEYTLDDLYRELGKEQKALCNPTKNCSEKKKRQHFRRIPFTLSWQTAGIRECRLQYIATNKEGSG